MESYPVLRIYLQISKFITKNVTSNIALIAFFCLQFIVSLKDSMYRPRTWHLLLIKTRCVYRNS